jgi:hypothetical protein
MLKQYELSNVHFGSQLDVMIPPTTIGETIVTQREVIVSTGAIRQTVKFELILDCLRVNTIDSLESNVKMSFLKGAVMRFISNFNSPDEQVGDLHFGDVLLTQANEVFGLSINVSITEVDTDVPLPAGSFPIDFLIVERHLNYLVEAMLLLWREDL